ncbi:ATP-binding protein [Clostridium sp. OF09-36]|uniref:ATP-binding protein n=1 Tax=Clostridium sp. OF09-36 TaxID=2292310 RepID=UPI000E508763|nr:ATP-binding protein [Clostridium sp. OF09-36]RHV87860.1 ATP-binding protein [Clostridium sp. OF09-36]HBM47337.1 Archaeal ATPase [Lachnoclostridium sp.]
MKRDNPFTLTFGKQPIKYINRYESTDNILSTFEADNPISQTYLISGIRGSGKTVLMTSVSNQLRNSDEWVVVDLNATQPLLQEFAMRLLDASKQIPNIFEKGFEISVAGFGIGYNGITEERDSVSKIETLLDRLNKKGKKVLITIDEAVANENMRIFASQFQIFIRKNYPVFLIMTGLYENIYEIQNDPVLTFLLRAPKIILGPLGINQIKNEYQNIFQIDDEKARQLANITMGYAFAFQALGMLYWEYHDEKPLDWILKELDGLLEDFVYRKIWSSLSPLEKQIVSAMPEQGTKIKVKELCDKLEMKGTTFSKYRERLINKGVCIAPEYGYVALALPRFKNITESYIETI